MTPAIASLPPVSATAPVAGAATASKAGASPETSKAEKEGTATADRFLKLLVAQMQNQDPLNPMDNAQVTSQMAQINTVNGIEKLNGTMQSMSSQLMQSQVLQGASLVGHDVVVPGDVMAFNDDDLGQGGFEIGSSADAVKVEILDVSGRVKDSFELGKLEAGTHTFDWPGDANTASSGASFRITATLANGANVPATTLMRDRVNAISTQGDSMTLDLENSGKTPYADIRSLN